MLAKLGVVPQQIAGSDIYSALERGTIDAAEWVGPYDDDKLGFSRSPGSTTTGASGKAPRALADRQREAVGIALAGVQGGGRIGGGRNPQALRKLVGEGAELRAFLRPVTGAAYQAAFQLYDDAGGPSAQFKKIYGPWRKYRDDAYLWFRVAEANFDSFVYSQSAQRS